MSTFNFLFHAAPPLFDCYVDTCLRRHKKLTLSAQNTAGKGWGTDC